MKKKIRVGLIVLTIVLIIVNFTHIDYSNFTWTKNLSSFIGIIAMISLIISLIIQIRYDKKQQAKLTDNSR
jgi:NADH:ubiquinone oxidoreductase subunit 2 (subunit N)